MMPVRAPSIRACGCVLSTGERCRHMVQRDRERKARFDQQRPSARQRGYDSKWQKEAKAFLAANPRCVMCGAPSRVVDHKTPHRGDMRLFWSRSNWQALCTPCHSGRKQREERR